VSVVPDVSADRPPAATPPSETSLGPYTTLRLGGPADTVMVAEDSDEAVAMVRKASLVDEPVLILAGGSNVVIGDEGFPGTVVLLRTSGTEVLSQDDRQVVTRVAAGTPWDLFVEETIARGFSGVECLSGIPGSVGATPIQNVGAYGQEVADLIVAVHAYDRLADETRVMTPAECRFGYRSSIFKHSDRWVVLDVDFRLGVSRRSAPIRYAELARRLGVDVGARVEAGQARTAVLELRAGKGMVLSPDDHDTWSVGSFFTNPVLSAGGWAAFPEQSAPNWPGPDGTVKLPAAWLIERAGFHKGFPGPGHTGISTKHTLALTNRGGGTTGELLALARRIRDGVQERFGVRLHPEPVLVNCEL
jgi:UDP-N-acetylmuramate dehydrogenase